MFAVDPRPCSAARTRPTSPEHPIERDHTRVCFAYQRFRRHRPVRRSGAVGLRVREQRRHSPARAPPAPARRPAATASAVTSRRRAPRPRRTPSTRRSRRTSRHCADANIDYQPTGSGAGIKQFIAKQVDFAGSDSSLKTTPKDGKVEAAGRQGRLRLRGLEPAHGHRPHRDRLQRQGRRQARAQRRGRRQDLRRQDHHLERPRHRRAQQGRHASRHADQGLLPLRRVGHDRELHEVPQGRRPRRLVLRDRQEVDRQGRGQGEVGRCRHRHEGPGRRHHLRRALLRPAEPAARWPRSTPAPAPSS